MTSFELNGEHLERFGSCLKQSKVRRINSETLWLNFHAAFPNRPRTHERAWFLSALVALERRGVIALPSPRGKRWDRALNPHVPTSVDLIQPKEPARDETWRRYPWRPELRWVRDLHAVTKAEEEFLLRVHQGLVNSAFNETAPLKYRSLQLTGHEKRLGELALQRLFTPGRLSLPLLGTESDHPPLASANLTTRGLTGHLLFVENAGTFQTMRQILREVENLPYDAIAFGDGYRVIASIRDLTDHDPTSISYVGDLDAKGLDILRALRGTCQTLQLPTPIAARGIHTAMIEAARSFGRDQGWPNDTKAADEPCITHLVEPLPLESRPQVAAMLRANHRIPEEVLGPKELRTIWAPGFDRTNHSKSKTDPKTQPP